MLREPVLNTKRLELGRCVAARKRKLSELYHVAATVAATVATRLQPPQPSPSSRELKPISEADFQDENDITRGRRFDIATVRRLPGGDANFTPGIAAKQDITARPSLDGKSPGGVEPSSQRAESNGQSHVSPVTSGSSDQAKAQSEHHAPQDTRAPQRPSKSTGQDAADGGDRPASLHATTTMPDGGLASRDGTYNSVLEPNKPAQDEGRATADTSKSVDRPQTSQLSSETRLKTEDHADFKVPRTPSEVIASKNERGVPLSSNNTKTESNGPSDNTIASRRTLANGEATGDVRPHQKVPMRIDTGVGQAYGQDSATPSSSFTPLRSAQAAMQSSPPERMTTRVSSGALRHKSVSEILGETPKLSPSSGERTAIQELTRDESSLVSRRSSFVQSPESTTFKARPLDLPAREKDKSKLSTVVFARHQGSDGARHGEGSSVHAVRKEKLDESKDYLVPLFAAQAAAQTPTLNHLIASAHKTLNTSNHYIDYHESQDCRILKRIYHLQNSNRWSLRQLERSAEPPRANTHWDSLLAGVKWMRTDFREERKWKLTAAKSLAAGCAEWVAASPEDRAALQVKVRPIVKQTSLVVDNESAPAVAAGPSDKMEIDSTPDLVHDETSDAGDDDLQHPELDKAPIPAALFELGPEDISFSMNKTPVAEKLLGELPLYQPFIARRNNNRPWSELLDAAWQRPIVPVSKHAVGKIVVRDDGPKRKRSRYEYAQEDDVEELTHSAHKKSLLSPKQDNVALFDPKNKHIVDRLHAGHAFRPPSQYPMPSQPFFESRYPSQWTTSEDDELRKLVREYEYNWNAISDFLTSPSLFSSGAERRTPWECFERWESFEGLPGEMDKHSYFRAWRLRKHNAKQRLEQLHQQQNAANAQFLRRRSAEPMRVERRKSDKHYALIGAIAKAAKKRETLLQKQQHAAQMAAIRKQPESTQLRLRMQTPQEFSAHKHKQEMEFKEKQMLYRQQMEQARRNALQQQKAAQQSVQHQSQQGSPWPGMPAPSVTQSRQPGLATVVNGASPRPGSSMGQQVPQPGNRPFTASQNMLNGMASNGTPVPVNRQAAMMSAAGMNVPQAQIQAFMQGQHQSMGGVQSGNETNRVMSEAMRLQEQQRMMQQRQVRAQANGHNPMGTLPNGMTPQQMQQNANLLASLQQNAKMPINGINAGQQRSSAGVAMAGASQGQQLSSGMVPLLNQISNQLRAMHPNAPAEQIKQMATQNLNQHLRNQNAQINGGMMGNASHSPHSQLMPQGNMPFNNMAAMNMNQQLYAQFLRSQQASQQRLSAGASGGTNSSGGSNEPNGNSSSRPGSRGTPSSQPRSSAAPKGASASPPPPQAQMAGSSS